MYHVKYLVTIDYEITICKSSDFLLKNINQFEILFLDIELDKENGIELSYDTQIIITSNFTKYLIDGYKICSTRYILKPIKQTIFNIEMEDVINNSFNKYLDFIDKKICNQKIYYKDILFIEFTSRKTHLLLANGISIPLSRVFKRQFEFEYAINIRKEYKMTPLIVSNYCILLILTYISYTLLQIKASSFCLEFLYFYVYGLFYHM